MSYDIKIDGIKTHGKHGVYEFEKIEKAIEDFKEKNTEDLNMEII